MACALPPLEATRLDHSRRAPKPGHCSLQSYLNYQIDVQLWARNVEELAPGEIDVIREGRQLHEKWLISNGVKFWRIDGEIIVIAYYDLLPWRQVILEIVKRDHPEIFEINKHITFVRGLTYILEQIIDETCCSNRLDIRGLFRYISRMRKLVMNYNDSNATKKEFLDKLEFSLDQVYEQCAGYDFDNEKILGNSFARKLSDNEDSDYSSGSETSKKKEKFNLPAIECSICLELLFAPVALNCSHNFCQLCIGIWRKENNSCPQCRKTIVSANRVLALDQVIEHVEREMIKEDGEFKEKREKQKKQHELMKNYEVAETSPRVARNFIHLENTEFEVVNGNLSQVRVQFDTPLYINPEDPEFDRLRNSLYINLDHEQEELR